MAKRLKKPKVTEGWDVCYKSGGNWKRLHKGIFLKKSDAIARKKQYQGPKYKTTSWAQNLKVCKAKVRFK